MEQVPQQTYGISTFPRPTVYQGEKNTQIPLPGYSPNQVRRNILNKRQTAQQVRGGIIQQFQPVIQNQQQVRGGITQQFQPGIKNTQQVQPGVQNSQQVQEGIQNKRQIPVLKSTVGKPTVPPGKINFGCDLDNYDRFLEALAPVIHTMSYYINTPWNNDLLTYYYPYGNTQAIPPQSHSGDLLEHSKWTAMQIMQWFSEDNNPLIDEELKLYMTDIVVAGLLHDISKAAECGYRCENERCWYDAYSELNYDRALDDNVHPEYSGDILMGTRNFYIDCPSEREIIEIENMAEQQVNWIKNDDEKRSRTKLSTISRLLHYWHRKNFSRILDVKSLFESLGVNRGLVALCAYMHWEFGRINQNAEKTSEEEAFAKYMDTFNKMCAKSLLAPSLLLLKICILVSMADIAAGLPPRVGFTDTRANTNYCNGNCKLGKLCGAISVDNRTDPIYDGNDPFGRFKMDVKGPTFKEKLLNYAIERYGMK